jgi:hypothetical protein
MSSPCFNAGQMCSRTYSARGVARAKWCAPWYLFSPGEQAQYRQAYHTMVPFPSGECVGWRHFQQLKSGSRFSGLGFFDTERSKMVGAVIGGVALGGAIYYLTK